MDYLLLETGGSDALLLEDSGALLLESSSLEPDGVVRPQGGVTGMVARSRVLFYQPVTTPYRGIPVPWPLPPSTENPPTLPPRGLTVLFPEWFVPPQVRFTPTTIIRRVTRWSSEDRCLVVEAVPRTVRWVMFDRLASFSTESRTVRWTRAPRSAIMPERDDHYI